MLNVADSGTVALDTKTGAKIWATRHPAVCTRPRLRAAVVYSGDNDNKIVELDVATGKQIGALTVSGLPTSAAVAAGVLYSANQDGTLTAFGSAASTPEASTPAASPISAPAASPVAGVEDGARLTFLWAAKFGSVANLLRARRSIWAPDIDDGHMWIVDRDGNSLGSWGKGGSAPGEFTFKKQGQDSWWGGIAFAPDGSFAIAECGNQRFETFDTHRTLVKSVGELGEGDGQFLSHPE